MCKTLKWAVFFFTVPVFFRSVPPAQGTGGPPPSPSPSPQQRRAAETGHVFVNFESRPGQGVTSLNSPLRPENYTLAKGPLSPPGNGGRAPTYHSGARAEQRGAVRHRCFGVCVPGGFLAGGGPSGHGKHSAARSRMQQMRAALVYGPLLKAKRQAGERRRGEYNRSGRTATD